MNIVIIDYHAGNTQSVAYALERLGISPLLTADPEKIKAADKVIFPGVGEASSTMEYLKSKKLDILIKELKQPVLGVCLGMQLMCSFSEEGNAHCLDIFPLQVKRFENKKLKVPHMGWNSLHNTKGWLKDIKEGSYAYFVHSFYVPLSEYTSATTPYGADFSAALQRDNFYAVQFHPEKSADTGAEILKSFLKL
jgi:glutamine amidotransferase